MVPDFDFLVFVYERLGDIGIMPILDRGTADERRPIRDRLFICGRREVLASRENWRGSANCAHWRHENVLRGNGDNRACRARISVDECVSGNSCLIERVHNIGGRVQPTTVRVHLKNDGGGFVALSCFYRTSQKR